MSIGTKGMGEKNNAQIGKNKDSILTYINQYRKIRLNAIQENDSMTKAAQSLHVTAYNTFKKYQNNMIYGNRIQVIRNHTRVRKFTWNGKKPLDKEIELQKELIKEFIKPQRCSGCGYSEYRKSDMLSPLIVHFVDGDVQNKKPSNIKLYCYNCYFINSDVKHRVHNPEIGDTFENKKK